MHDVIVVGAGAAGCPLAMLLARRGHRVLLLERNGIAEDRPLVHNLGPTAIFLLERWGLLDQLVATGSPAADRTIVWAGSRRSDLPNPAEARLTYAPRHSALIPLLTSAALAAGAEIRPHFTVRDLVWEGDAVSGVVGQGEDGHTVYERAAIVVGADGRSSVVARVVEAEAYEERLATSCCYYAYWRGPTGSAPEVHLRARRAVAIYPTDGGMAWVVAARPVSEWASYKRGPEQMYMDQLGLFPELAGRLRRATRQSRFGGTADLGCVLRRPWGPGWALIGDAAQPRDDTLGLGTSGVFAPAQMLATAIDDGLSGRASFLSSLTRYHRWRDDHANAGHVAACALSSYDWSVDEVAGVVAEAHAARVSELQGLLSACR